MVKLKHVLPNVPPDLIEELNLKFKSKNLGQQSHNPIIPITASKPVEFSSKSHRHEQIEINAQSSGNKFKNWFNKFSSPLNNSSLKPKTEFYKYKSTLNENSKQKSSSVSALFRSKEKCLINNTQKKMFLIFKIPMIKSSKIFNNENDQQV